MIAFVAGGARSGKSAVAEALTREYRQGREGAALVYLATARVGDDEMAARVARHRRERGEGWLTLEAPLELADALEGVEEGSSVLLDCLTLWAGQWLFEAERDEAAGRAMLARLLAAARRRSIALVVVSNDLNEELPPRALGKPKLSISKAPTSPGCVPGMDRSGAVWAGSPSITRPSTSGLPYTRSDGSA